ncbi:MAG: glycosyltransferase family 4 protein [Planctomycetes bacterium]|nr:glycosyltransferase family 4 protein [Planctomycetota bacterium]
MTTASSHSRPVRVCFVSPKAYPLFDPAADGVIGGAEVDLYLLATELAKDENYKVSCITADYGQQAEQKIENVQVIKSLNFKQNNLTGAYKIWKAMKKANADIYMIKTASSGVALTAVFCKLHKKAFLYRTAHQYECDGTYIRNHFLLGKAFARSLRSARIIFAQNADDGENLKLTLGCDSVVIPNGHRIPDTMDSEKKTILWVGRTADFKKPLLFLDIARNFPDEHFVMICQKATGDNDYDSFVAKAKQIENLTFINQVPFNEIETYFRDAKILVNTSDSEGFPNTFIQAAKYATAILSLNVNPDNFLEKNNCGIHAKGDIDQMADSLSSLIKDNKFTELGKNARQYVEKYHDVKQIAKQYKNLFGKVSRCQ